MAEDPLADLPVLQRLALSYAPRSVRPATLGVLALDARLAAIVRRGREPALAQMRLAWWRDTMAKPVGDWPKGDAVLAELRGWTDPSSLGPLVDGWEWLLAERLDAKAVGQFASGRGRAFAALAEEIGATGSIASAEQAGETWALGDLAANLGSEVERKAVVEIATNRSRLPLPRTLRPLAVLEGLARRALGKGGTELLDGPGAALAAVRLGITGR